MADIPYYLDYLPQELLDHLQENGDSVDAVPGLTVTSGLRDEFADIETDEALAFVVDLYRRVREPLRRVLHRRSHDRVFIDERVTECAQANVGIDFRSAEYATPIGIRDEAGRVPVGPLPRPASKPRRVAIPPFLTGEQVTLFGPPDTAKLSINAMNALHRKPDDEPAIVTRLVEELADVPRWGADNEDSKTPIMRNFLLACQNLIGCYRHDLQFTDERRGRDYRLADDDLAIPIKRIPGLALPDGNHLLNGSPIPLHLFDFAMHMFHNWRHPEALVFYVPKLENEEEAAYLHTLVTEGERCLRRLHPEYEMGTVGLFVVFENPRAIFRIREIADALWPHFLGGSLGWHDFLGSTARLFKNDPRYRIPVKADPNIVINHIKESHEILVSALDPIGAITIGGMYGVLYEDGNPMSYEVSIVGYIRDVVTQLKRGLDGFWVAHPDFVRPGLALVAAFRRWSDDPADDSLRDVVRAMVPNPSEHEPLLEFVFGDDVEGLDESDPRYPRAVLAADIEMSDVIANHDPDEIRYNVFQAVQYLADWLRGNGCVALPAKMKNAAGEDVFVRIMDDLATTERSRWEVWAEVAHGRVPRETFEAILSEEMQFIRRGEDTESKRIAVPCDGEAERWYPIAERLLRAMIITADPPEFVTELLLPFTLDDIRHAEDPWRAAIELCPEKYE